MDKKLSWSNGKEWGKIYCPMLDETVMTYWKKGTPCYDTYTNPFVNEDGEIYCYRYDHDLGAWHEDDTYWLGEYNGIDTCKFG
jgi:hypothetical protein